MPEYLQAALPQLSDAALEDAAQPLDDLEEHRRNVAELSRTGDALAALAAVYESYAREELRRRAGQAAQLADDAERAGRAASQAEAAALRAAARVEETEAQIAEIAAEERRLRNELEALRSSPAYQAGAELHDLRDHVATLERQLAAAEAGLRRAGEASERAGEELRGAASAAENGRSSLQEALGELGELALAGGLSARAPDLPALQTGPLEVGATTPGHDATSGSVTPAVPLAGLDAAATEAALAELRAALHHREGDVAELRAELRVVEACERRLSEATRALERAASELQATQQTLDAARAELDEAVRAWRGELAGWLAALRAHCGQAGLPPPADEPDLAIDLAARRDEVTRALEAALGEVLGDHLRRHAAAAVRRDGEAREQAELAAALEELERRQLPPPPALSWQAQQRGPVLAELVEFAPSLHPADRARLEAALEASGLLGAELRDDGTILLDEGGLELRPGPRAALPLSALLEVTIPPELAGSVAPASVAALLDSISTDPGELVTSAGPAAPAPIDPAPIDRAPIDPAAIDRAPIDPAPLDSASAGPVSACLAVVTLDGRFRVGVLAGRHTKSEPEHVGISARRAALERQRGEVRARLALARRRARGDRAPAHDDRGADRRGRGAAAPPCPGHAASTSRSSPSVRPRRPSTPPRSAIASAARRCAAPTRSTPRPSTRAAGRRPTCPFPSRTPGWRRWNGRSNGHTAPSASQASGSARCDASSRHGAPPATGSPGPSTPKAVPPRRASRRRTCTSRSPRGWPRSRTASARPTRRSCASSTPAITSGRMPRSASRAAGATSSPRPPSTPRRPSGAAAGRNEHEGALGRARAGLPQLRRALEVPGLLAAAAPGAAAALTAPVESSASGLRSLAATILDSVPAPARAGLGADGVRLSLRQRRDSLGSGWDAEDRQPDERLPLSVEVIGPEGQLPLPDAVAAVASRRHELAVLLSSEQDEALRDLLQGLVAREVAEKLHAASELVGLMNRRLETVRTAHGIGVLLRWRRRADLDAALARMVELLAKPPDLRTDHEVDELRAALAARLDEARSEDPEAPYRELIGRVLDYRSWHEMHVLLRRPGQPEERLSRRSALSEGEKKIVTYLPLFAAVAASCDALAESAPDAPRFVLLDDAFAKVSEDNHPKLFGLLVELDLDFIATSERLWGTHSSVPQLAITEVLRDAELGVIVLEHYRWDGTSRSLAPVEASR